MNNASLYGNLFNEFICDQKLFDNLQLEADLMLEKALTKFRQEEAVPPSINRYLDIGVTPTLSSTELSMVERFQ